MREVLRTEKKFLLNQAEYKKTSHYLSQLLAGDPHNEPGGYPVRSLYFDTEYDRDFFDKEEGLYNRKKLRLRLYDPDGSWAVLEMKQKQGDQQKKRSLRLSREDALSLTACNYEPLLRYREDFAGECYALMHMRGYRPRTIVEYRREAFVAKENRIRLTFDREVRATESNFGLFDPRLNLNPVLDADRVVLEVKYNGFLLSYVKQLLSGVDKSELSVSKYCLARRNSYQVYV